MLTMINVHRTFFHSLPLNLQSLIFSFYFTFRLIHFIIFFRFRFVLVPLISLFFVIHFFFFLYMALSVKFLSLSFIFLFCLFLCLICFLLHCAISSQFLSISVLYTPPPFSLFSPCISFLLDCCIFPLFLIFLSSSSSSSFPICGLLRTWLKSILNEEMFTSFLVVAFNKVTLSSLNSRNINCYTRR